MGRIVKWSVSVVVACGTAVTVATSAQAAPPILGTADDTVQFEADGDELTASLAVTNPSATPMTLTFVGLNTVGQCTFRADPPTVPAHRTIDVEITSAGCEIPTNGEVLEMRSGTDVVVSLTAKPPNDPEPLDVQRIVTTFGITAVGALVVAAVVLARRPLLPDPPLSYDDDGDLEEPQPAPPYPPGTKVRLTDELAGVGADWSFSDSWATNISAFATIFVALLGSTDVLEAVLGEEPEQAVGRILVAGALAAFLTGAAPLALKAFGGSVKPSAGGLLVGGVLTLTGVAGQILTIGWAISETGLEDPWNGRTVTLSYVGAGALLWYGYRTMHLLLVDAFKPAPVKAPDASLYLAAVLLAGSTTPPPTPSQLAHTAARLGRAKPATTPSTYPPGIGTSRAEEYRSAVL